MGDEFLDEIRRLRKEIEVQTAINVIESRRARGFVFLGRYTTGIPISLSTAHTSSRTFL